MLEGVERLIDLTGFQASPDVAPARDSVLGAIRAGNIATLAATGGHFAGTAREGQTVRLARTIGVPLRYFVAKMYHGPFLVVSDRIDRIFEWCQSQRIGWQFEPAYTRTIPAHYLVELDQVGCPDPMPRYRRFFEPAIASGPADVDALGAAYVRAALDALTQWIASVPAGEPIAIAFSGGVDSTSVWVLARHAASALGRNPDDIRAFTLDFGGGTDAAQAEEVARSLGLEAAWERVAVPASAYDLDDAIMTIEDYHPLDVECAAAALCLLRGIRERYPSLRYLVDGDGGDENLKAYPLEDSDLTLSSILRNPMLYQEGWGIDAIKHSLVYSGGLSRGYVRTFAPAARYGFTAFSPYSTRAAIAAAVAIPFDTVLGGDPARLMTLKQDIVAAGVKAVTGVEMPIRAKRRFQDGAQADPRPRVTKAWCQRTFEQLWRERLRQADEDANTRRSGNEMSVPVR
ncbi:MAG TPA: asparagine synthase-related protein [Vicinamibacterales bacterium]|jgi:asparagine synthase (glutamine-hydrolysing)|nr:asparagine synthase-related protein [Vicinamibacterales bacterium]